MRKSLWILALCGVGAAIGAEPKPQPSPQLPVIEINRSSSPVTPLPAATNGTIELAPIEGQKALKMSGQGRVYWSSPYGMPSGPGRAWPDAAPPGTPGPAGGLMRPAGYPGRF